MPKFFGSVNGALVMQLKLKCEKLGIRANTEYQPFHYTAWHPFLVTGNLQSGVFLAFLFVDGRFFRWYFAGIFLQFLYQDITKL